MVAVPVNAVLAYAVGLSGAFQPVKYYLKTVSKQISKKALKNKITGKITSFVRNAKAKTITMSSNASKYIRKVTKAKKGSFIWKHISTAKINSKISGALKDQTIGRIVSIAVDNIDTFSSVGGFIAGCIDYNYDKRVNNVLWRI